MLLNSCIPIHFLIKTLFQNLESQSPVCLDHSVEPPADPATAPIKPGIESTIEINKDKVGLGLSIVGGSDTLLVIIINNTQ